MDEKPIEIAEIKKPILHLNFLERRRVLKLEGLLHKPEELRKVFSDDYHWVL